MHLTSRWLFILAPLLLAAGCTKNAEKASQAALPGEEADIQAALAKLDPADRKLAEAALRGPEQDPSGIEMDAPFKVMVKGQPVFLCCDGCEKKALADPEKTLARVAELKARAVEPTTK